MPARPHVLILVCALLASACGVDNEGDPPPEGKIYFPNGVLLSPHAEGEPARYLLVANTNFDLLYHSGSVQAYDLDRLDAAIESCETLGQDDCMIETVPPKGVDPTDEDADPKLAGVLADEVLIGPYANGITLGTGGEHLFVATRTDESLTVIGLDADAPADATGKADVLSCDERNKRCRRAADRGENPNDSGYLRWAQDPVALVARPLSDWAPDAEGDYVVSAHLDGSVSLFVEADTDDEGEPLFTLTDVERFFPGSLTAVAHDPLTNLIHVTSTNRLFGKRLGRVGVAVPERDGAPDPLRASLYSVPALQLEGTAPRNDARAIHFLDEGLMEPDLRTLIVSREPDALLLADVSQDDSRSGVGSVRRTVTLGSGPSKLSIATLGDAEDAVRVAAVSCFNGREVFIVDLETMFTRAVVPNLSGPFDLALDGARQKLYVADFRTSVVRVIDLSPLTAPALTDSSDEPVPAPRVIATLGRPQSIQELR